jgi:hypothetical protein
MKNKLIFALILICLSLKSEACSCFGPNTFLKTASTHILELKYLGIDSILEVNSSGKAYKKAVKKLVLIEFWLQPNDSDVLDFNFEIVPFDTLFLLEGNGANCRGYLHDAEINEHYLFRLSKGIISESFLANSPNAKKLIISVSLCTEPILWLDKHRVRGNISANKESRMLADADEYLVFARHFREKAYQYEYKSFAREYYHFWSQAGEWGFQAYRHLFLNNKNYYKRGQSWSAKRLKYQIKRSQT